MNGDSHEKRGQAVIKELRELRRSAQRNSATALDLWSQVAAHYSKAITEVHAALVTRRSANKRHQKTAAKKADASGADD